MNMSDPVPYIVFQEILITNRIQHESCKPSFKTLRICHVKLNNKLLSITCVHAKKLDALNLFIQKLARR